MASIIISLDAMDLQKLANREELEVPVDIPVTKGTQHYVQIRLTPNAVSNLSNFRDIMDEAKLRVKEELDKQYTTFMTTAISPENVSSETVEFTKKQIALDQKFRLIKDEWPRSSSIIASPMYKAKDLKKYRIDCGYGIVYLVTPYDPEERFPVLANTCFGLRKTWERCDILDASPVEEDDYERLMWGGDEYIWRMDGARRMVTPNPDKEWDMDYCKKCKKE